MFEIFISNAGFVNWCAEFKVVQKALTLIIISWFYEAPSKGPKDTLTE